MTTGKLTKEEKAAEIGSAAKALKAARAPQPKTEAKAAAPEPKAAPAKAIGVAQAVKPKATAETKAAEIRAAAKGLSAARAVKPKATTETMRFELRAAPAPEPMAAFANGLWDIPAPAKAPAKVPVTKAPVAKAAPAKTIGDAPTPEPKAAEIRAAARALKDAQAINA
ncbi:MAG: hypothetical protein LBF58_10080, partial [Deltaproteobacteria bacterium]|nr:hypothetical protein [Deltaproteobacteria bacterium]